MPVTGVWTGVWRENDVSTLPTFMVTSLIKVPTTRDWLMAPDVMTSLITLLQHTVSHRHIWRPGREVEGKLGHCTAQGGRRPVRLSENTEDGTISQMVV